jgi:hypothetical protein
MGWKFEYWLECLSGFVFGSVSEYLWVFRY